MMALLFRGGVRIFVMGWDGGGELGGSAEG